MKKLIFTKESQMTKTNTPPPLPRNIQTENEIRRQRTLDHISRKIITILLTEYDHESAVKIFNAALRDKKITTTTSPIQAASQMARSFG